MPDEQVLDPTHRGRSYGYLLLCCALAMLGAVASLSQRWVTEDAYITFRYVTNFLSGHGAVYNQHGPRASAGKWWTDLRRWWNAADRANRPHGGPMYRNRLVKYAWRAAVILVLAYVYGNSQGVHY